MPRQQKEPETFVRPVVPVQPVVVKHEPEAKPNRPPETIRERPTNSVPESTNLAPNNSKNSDNSQKPNETIELFERIGKVGRQRKYEEKGNRGENSVRDVVLYRHIKGRHYPGLSSDMRRWYEFFYFKSPMRGEKPFNANTNYEQHIEAYERGQDWIKRYEAGHTKSITRPMGDSRIVDLQTRRAVN